MSPSVIERTVDTNSQPLSLSTTTDLRNGEVPGMTPVKTISNTVLSVALIAGMSAAGPANGNPGSSAGGDPVIDRAREAVADGDYRKALNYLNRHLRKERRDADALNLMGYSLRKLERFEEAESYYLRALKFEPGHLGANEYLGELYLETGRPELARERLAVLEKVCPDECEERRELDKALARYTKGEGP